MIRVERLKRLYGDFCAVNNISFSIGQGEIVGLLGHNGAGKTTTMKMMTGFLEPTAGEIIIDNKNIQYEPEHIQSLIGYLPENLPVYPEMCVMDYLIFCAKIRNIEKRKRIEAAYLAIEKTELQSKATAQISTLSRGYKQRVGVAQALLHQPKLLILDEPTNGLDPHQTHQMRDLILNLADDATVILSTHIMQEVKAICGRVMIMDNGSLVIDQPLVSLQKIDSIQLISEATTAEISECLKTFNVSISDEKVFKGRSHIDIAVNDETDIDELCNQLAVRLVTLNKRIFSLSPQHQDLEDIFKHANKVKGALNAA